MRRYLEILELETGASLEQVREAYRDMVRVWHPDRFGSDERLREKANERLKEINLAYEELTAHWDAWLIERDNPQRLKLRSDGFPAGAAACAPEVPTRESIDRALEQIETRRSLRRRLVTFLIWVGLILLCLGVIRNLPALRAKIQSRVPKHDYQKLGGYRLIAPLRGASTSSTVLPQPRAAGGSTLQIPAR